MAIRSRVTSFEIAERAGVSQPTVSRALRGMPGVHPETRRRVLEVAKELCYTADFNASRLRTGRTRTIALVMLCRTDEDRARINPFYQALLGAVAAASADCGYSLLISFQDPDHLFGEYETAGLADGVIVIGSSAHAAGWSYFADLADNNRTIVGWGCRDCSIHRVRTANAEGGYLATKHLLDMGARRPVLLSCEPSIRPQFGERQAGFERAVATLGLTPDIAYVEQGPTRFQEAFDKVAAMAARGWAYDGLFATCDLYALGAMKALQAAGIAIPAQTMVIGFDGLEAGEFSTPTLSTITQNFGQVARRLVDNMCTLIDGVIPDGDPVPATLTVRESTQVAA